MGSVSEGCANLRWGGGNGGNNFGVCHGVCLDFRELPKFSFLLHRMKSTFLPALHNGGLKKTGVPGLKINAVLLVSRPSGCQMGEGAANLILRGAFAILSVQRIHFPWSDCKVALKLRAAGELRARRGAGEGGEVREAAPSCAAAGGITQFSGTPLASPRSPKKRQEINTGRLYARKAAGVFFCNFFLVVLKRKAISLKAAPAAVQIACSPKRSAPILFWRLEMPGKR